MATMELCEAIKSGNVRNVEQAIRAGADPNGRRAIAAENPLSVAAESGRKAMVKCLLDAGADPNWKWAWPPALYEAAIEGHAAIVTLLLEHGANPNILNEEGETPLMGAAASGHKVIAQRLLDAGAKAAKRSRAGTTSIEVAAANGHWNVVDVLAPHSPRVAVECADRMRQCVVSDTDETMAKSFVEAAWAGDIRTIRSMLDQGIPVDVATAKGSTALMEAANRGHLEVIKLLLERGADLRVKDAFGDTALTMAAKGSKSFAAFEYLYAIATAKDRKRIERIIRWKQMLPDQYPEWQGWKPREATNAMAVGGRRKKAGK